MSCDIDTITAAEKDICYLSGDEISNNGTFAVTDESDNPVDFSAIALIMHVKRRKTDPEAKAVIVFKTSDSTLTVSGSNGNFITMHGKYVIDQDTYYHDLERQDIGETIMKGKFLTEGDVTRI